MPQPFSDAVITAAGAALLLRVETGEAALEVTKIVVGDGVYSAAERTAANLRQRTALKSARNTYTPSHVSIVSEDSIKITTLISNLDPVTEQPLITSGYFINEIGVYAKEEGGASSTEVLYCIAVTGGDTGDYMPAYAGGGAAQITQDIYLTVGNAATTYVNAAGAAFLATEGQELKTRVADLETCGFSVVDGKLNVTYTLEE